MYAEVQHRPTAAGHAHLDRRISNATKPAFCARKHSAGQTLYREGDTAHYVFEVLTGVVCQSRVMPDGRRQIIGFGYPGDFTGFPANGQHHTDCEVVADGQVVAHRRDALENGRTDPELHMRLINAALHEITGMQDHCVMLGRKSAREKTAAFLSALMDRIGTPLGNYIQVSIPMSRSDIADFLGLTTETVSRTFTLLRDDGLIALENARNIIVLRPEDLRDLSLTE